MTSDGKRIDPPRMNAKAVIRIGRRRSRAPRAPPRPAASFLVLHLRELHDQDRVLGRQPDQGDQANLREDIVLEAAQTRAPERAEDRDGVPKSTLNGNDQLSYCAARIGNTNTSDRPK